MDIERFKALADVYGSDLARWPEAARSDAKARAESDPVFTQAFAEAIALDEALDLWGTPRPSAALRSAVLASATRRPKFWAVRLGRRGIGLWLSGAGMAAALTGVICGALASTAAMANARDEALVAIATSDGLGSFGATDERRQRFTGQTFARRTEADQIEARQGDVSEIGPSQPQ